MSGERPQPYDGQEAFNRATRELDQAVNDSIYERLAAPTTVLTLDQLPVGIIDAPEFQDVVRVMGWPEAADTDRLQPRRTYASDQTFQDSLLVGPRAMSGTENISLGNFVDRLSVRPLAILFPETDQAGQPTGRWRSPRSGFDANPYEVDPVLFRAEHVAPDLIHGLHGVLNYSPVGTEDDFNNRPDWLTAIIESDQGPAFTKGVHLAYKLMGRLVKPSDRQTQAQIMLGVDPNTLPLVTNVHNYLTS